MIKAMIFDLDDTLYDEWQYVSQAFANTADYLARRLETPERKGEFYGYMLEIVRQKGRGRVFDVLCEEAGVHLPIDELVEAYRSTRPCLKLYPDAEQILQVLEENNVKTGLITDGCSLVQHEKIAALGLKPRLDSVIVTDDYGICKPQTTAYEKCLQELKCVPGEAAYVGDNPRKDFIGAKKLGMKTFRILREKGMFMKEQADAGGEADYRIRSLTELIPWVTGI